MFTKLSPPIKHIHVDSTPKKSEIKSSKFLNKLLALYKRAYPDGALHFLQVASVFYICSQTQSFCRVYDCISSVHNNTYCPHLILVLREVQQVVTDDSVIMYGSYWDNFPLHKLSSQTQHTKPTRPLYKKLKLKDRTFSKSYIPCTKPFSQVSPPHHPTLN